MIENFRVIKSLPMTENFLIEYGYIGLFLVSFISATLFPLASEAFVAWMPTAGFDIWLILLFASTGNFLGALTNYYIGKWGGNFVFARFMKTDEGKIERAKGLFQRWGTPILFFSWIPIIGDPLAVVGGLMNVRLATFSFWVFTGKVLRYLFVLGIAQFAF